MAPNFNVSDPPTFVNEFSNKLESLNIKLVAVNMSQASQCLSHGVLFVNYGKVQVKGTVL